MAPSYSQWLEPTVGVKGSRQGRSSSQQTRGNRRAAVGRELDHVGEWTWRFCSKKRFSGDGNSGAAEYKVWKRWERAALVVKKVGGMPSPRGSGALDVRSSGWSGRTGTGIDRNQAYVHGWRRGARLPRTRSAISRQGGSGRKRESKREREREREREMRREGHMREERAV